jgi:enamine deaminase RidA (YjgF/YER057c/UK114 family)
MTPVRYLSPEGLHRNPAFSQVVTVEGPHRMVYVGGQNAVDAAGRVVGEGDVAAQCAQVAKNLRAALAAAGAGPEHVVTWRVHLVEGASPRAAFEAFGCALGPMPHAPAVAVARVAGLAHPSFLVEIEAVAAVPLP